MSQMLVNDFGGQVPSDVDELQKLPGVGRKTANVIASVVFDIPTMAVDTHVFRVANRIGLTTNSKTPFATEKELVKNIRKSNNEGFKIPVWNLDSYCRLYYLIFYRRSKRHIRL
jgi:endonuclease III